jgi:pyrroloquinoline quinone (PQQ) biosynthesis protein C
MSFTDVYNEQIKISAKRMKNFSWENKECYADWLSQTYYFVNWSTRLISLACAHFDMSNEKLHRRFTDYVREERGHDVMLVNDLRALNSKIGDHKVLPVTNGFYQSQFFQIQHLSPAAFFGYIFALEGLAVEAGGEAYERTKKAFGEKAASFLRVHSAEDPEHVKNAFESLKEINSQDQALIIDNFYQSSHLYSIMLDTIEARQLGRLQKTA